MHWQIKENILRGASILPVLTLLFVQSLFSQQFRPDYNTLDSGGILIPEQAAYNVSFYDLDVRVDTENRSIEGVLTLSALVVQPMSWLVLDLDSRLEVESVSTPSADWYISKRNEYQFGTRPQAYSRFIHENGQLWIELGRTYQPGERISRSVHYGGSPRVAVNPPWNGGFTWSKTADGSPWVAVSCQMHGADLWWPVKDHPSDRPDSMSIHITVESPLTAASNGRSRGVTPHDDGTSTWHWFVSTPISNYNVTANIAPYETLSDSMISVAGDTMEVIFWVLPEDVEKGKALFPQFVEQMAFFEELLGPYPFRADKYGIVHTPFLGMEHQSLIAYGAGFRNDVLFNMRVGYDDLMHHELAHEWWGNLVSVYDWKDFWLHEGFATYMQALYVERLAGHAAYHRQVARFRTSIANRVPLAPRETKSTMGISGGNEVYFKGASVLHTLRLLAGDTRFFEILRRFAYPDPALELTSDGSAMRFTSTNEFRKIAEQVYGSRLDWFFDVYVHQPHLPELVVERNGRDVVMRWITPDDLPFNMPVPVQINNEHHLVEFENNRAEIQLPRSVRKFEVDELRWVLRK